MKDELIAGLFPILAGLIGLTIFAALLVGPVRLLAIIAELLP